MSPLRSFWSQPDSLAVAIPGPRTEPNDHGPKIVLNSLREVGNCADSNLNCSLSDTYVIILAMGPGEAKTPLSDWPIGVFLQDPSVFSSALGFMQGCPPLLVQTGKDEKLREHKCFGKT